tara:strand:- start:2934 stop:3398 length:465 start_codon:yes stop_codon:yes gene_type:complete
MVEVAVAMSMASSAYNAIKKGMEMGREAQDVAEFFGRWFDAKENIAEANQYAQNPSMFGKMFSGKSVEAQALQVTSAKYKIAQMEKELREYLIYTGQSDFYEDMMIERRKIREQRLIRARAKAEFRKNVLDGVAIFVGAIVCAVIIAGTVSIIV